MRQRPRGRRRRGGRRRFREELAQALRVWHHITELGGDLLKWTRLALHPEQRVQPPVAETDIEHDAYFIRKTRRAQHERTRAIFGGQRKRDLLQVLRVVLAPVQQRFEYAKRRGVIHVVHEFDESLQRFRHERIERFHRLALRLLL